jgi:Fic family protein
VFLKLFQQINKLAIRSAEDFMLNDAQEYTSMTKTQKILSSQQLMFKFPTLSEKAAQFYVANNNPENSYTIQSFREYVGSSYETARYSLDNLVKLGLYSKTKVGKKYVYKAK